jgi:glutamine synthetase
MKYHLEYVWIDGIDDLRSKIKIEDLSTPDIENIPIWTFDSSSTFQGEGFDSDVLLIPVRLYKNPFVDYMPSYLVLCECYNKDMTPHETNSRNVLKLNDEKYKEYKCWFGIEQEYILFERKKNGVATPYKWQNYENAEYPEQGVYYCGVGGDRVYSRNILNKHLELSLKAGINICGCNLEVTPSQLEFQIGICDPLTVADDLWMARYILNRVCEEFECRACFDPKPLKNYNGTGAHTNYSDIFTRDKSNGLENIKKVCDKLKLKHSEHMEMYGKNNRERLIGIHETSNYDNFGVGYGDRGKSIRIPINVLNSGCGYIEDRRPAGNMDPYKVVNIMMETILS